MAEVFDLDALATEGTPFRFTFAGEQYELPPDIDMRVLELASVIGEEGAEVALDTLYELTRGLLGVEQWERLKASPKVFGVQALTALLNAYMKHLGVSLGEFEASTGSSKSTARPSKRTSKGSTGSRSRRLAGGSRGGGSAS